MKSYYVYILASRSRGTLYTGVTSNLAKRVYEHKQGLVEGFTDRHKVKMLVYYEETNNIESAIMREKRIKRWNRLWKIKLIEKMNPNWDDLYEQIL